MKEKKYSLRELSQHADVEPRTIRYYISEGLLRGPESMGRNAYYGEQHLKRLRTIKLLKETYGLPLGRIRKYLLSARTDEDLEVVPLDRIETLDQENSGTLELPSLGASPPAPHVSRKAAMEPILSQSLTEPPASLAPTPLESLLKSLRTCLGSHRVPRQAKGSPITHIEITPEVGLTIHGDHTPREMAQFEMLADHLREILLGGVEADILRREPAASASGKAPGGGKT